MKTSRKLNGWLRYSIIVLLGLWMTMSVNSAYAEWHYGIGTGMFRLNVKGDIHIGTKSLGPVDLEVDLDPDDISDLMESAFGFGGYATDGTWTIMYSFSQLKLGGDSKDTLDDGRSLKTIVDFDMTGGEIVVGRKMYQSKHIILSLEGGARYTKHDLQFDLRVDGDKNKKDYKNHWTDALIGVGLAVPITDKLIWNNRANAGFGGSEGTYFGYTGLTWRFLKHWSGTLYGNYTAVDFENGDKDDSDFYHYDTDQYGVGLSILFNW